MNRTLATSLTVATFLIIAISGTMMFFHFFDKNVKSLHEFLGLAFIIAVILHLFYNWKSMKSYFNKKTFYASLIVGALATLVFVSIDGDKKGDPKRVLITSILNAPIQHSYAVLNIKNVEEKLAKAGIEVFEEKSLSQIAEANGISPFKLINILTTAK